MTGKATVGLSLLLLLAAVVSAAEEKSECPCSCKIGDGLSQEGQLIDTRSKYCVVVGVGVCIKTGDGGFVLDKNATSRLKHFVPSRCPSTPKLRRPLNTPTQSSWVREAAATASPAQRRRALEAVRRRLEATRQQERELIESGRGTVRPGSASAVLANERRPDAKSLELGNRALRQILYLQALLGGNERR